MFKAPLFTLRKEYLLERDRPSDSTKVYMS